MGFISLQCFSWPFFCTSSPPPPTQLPRPLDTISFSFLRLVHLDLDFTVVLVHLDFDFTVVVVAVRNLLFSFDFFSFLSLLKLIQFITAHSSV